jgi:hypothetical protein
MKCPVNATIYELPQKKAAGGTNNQKKLHGVFNIFRHPPASIKKDSK